MASSKSGAETIVAAASKRRLPRSDLDASILDKLLLLLGENAELRALLDRMGTSVRPVLRLDGKSGSHVDSNITLEGPFTVETWIGLTPASAMTMGFSDVPAAPTSTFTVGHFRVYGGPAHGDRIIAKRAMTADLWTHVAVSRDETGRFRIYLDGELDNADGEAAERNVHEPGIGRVAPPTVGTGATLAEYRVLESLPHRRRNPRRLRPQLRRRSASPGSWRDTSRAAAPGANSAVAPGSCARSILRPSSPPLEARALAEKMRNIGSLPKRPATLATANKWRPFVSLAIRSRARAQPSAQT